MLDVRVRALLAPHTPDAPSGVKTAIPVAHTEQQWSALAHEKPKPGFAEAVQKIGAGTSQKAYCPQCSQMWSSTDLAPSDGMCTRCKVPLSIGEATVGTVALPKSGVAAKARRD